MFKKLLLLSIITTTTFYLFGENIYPCKKVEKSSLNIPLIETKTFF